MHVFFIKPGGEAQTNFPHQYAVLSAYVKNLGHHVDFYDAALKHETPEDVLNKFDYHEVDVIAMSVLTGWHMWARDFTTLIKEKYPHIRLIVGGHHISGLKELAMEHIRADYGVVGEGEIPLGKILSSLDDLSAIKNLPGVIYKENNVYKKTPFPLERVGNLDDLPMPNYELIRPEDYFHTYLGASVSRKYFKNVQTVTSRGCPYHCTFCATNSTWQAKIKFYSPERVIDEIKHLVNNFGIRELWLGDDGFTSHKRRAMEICERIISEKIKIAWRVPNGVRLDTLDEKLVSLMRRAGCYMTGIGVETGSPEMMIKIKKKLDLGLVEEKVRLLKKYNILPSGFFMLGFPEETEKTIRETVDFILKSSLPRMQICVYVPLPGSESFDKVFGIDDREKYEENVRRFLCEGYIPEVRREVTPEAIKKEYWETLVKFYSKPSVVFSVIAHMRPRQVKDIITRFLWYDGIFDRNRDRNKLARNGG